MFVCLFGVRINFRTNMLALFISHFVCCWPPFLLTMSTTTPAHTIHNSSNFIMCTLSPPLARRHRHRNANALPLCRRHSTQLGVQAVRQQLRRRMPTKLLTHRQCNHDMIMNVHESLQKNAKRKPISVLKILIIRIMILEYISSNKSKAKFCNWNSAQYNSVNYYPI